MGTDVEVSKWVLSIALVFVTGIFLTLFLDDGIRTSKTGSVFFKINIWAFTFSLVIFFSKCLSFLLLN